MNTCAFAALEGFASQEARRKRLGQYFSGPPLARLLVVLAARPSIRSAIDPMAGRGDMLVAARGLLPKCSQLHGIEIDPVAHGQCAATLEGTNALCLSGNAFDPATLSLLAPHGYDLVVTNPPYVRYQAQKHGAGTQVRLPSALEVRNGLRRCLGNLPHLCDSDRADFLALAEGYSGHSDLAVPSWILCAALLAPGGTLAMVVPEAWLNRDYAAIVRYLLLRWFRIEFIVEDAHAAWFSDALVKTTLLVAHRTGARASAHAWSDETYLHVSLPSTLASEESLLGRSRYARTRHAERAFARHARALLGGKADTLDDAIAWQRVRMADQAAALHGAAHGDSWYRRLESGTQFAPGQVSQVPPSLAGLLPASSGFTTLAQAGVSVGQGLRTGANEFFYADVLSRNERTVRLRLSKLFDGATLDVPASCTAPAVRRQRDIAAPRVWVRADELPGAVLALRSWALPEAVEASYEPLPTALAAHVRKAAKTPVGAGAGAKLLPALSAVAPNARKANARADTPARHWYMLPDFAPRHRPDLFIARINSDRPRTILNRGRDALVDANFSTLWLTEPSDARTHMFLAYLNGTLAWALFEHMGAVMGGGALKLEATHLAGLPVPRFSPAAVAALTRLGAALSRSNGTQDHATLAEIDRVVCAEVFGDERVDAGLAALTAAASSRLEARRHRP